MKRNGKGVLTLALIGMLLFCGAGCSTGGDSSQGYFPSLSGNGTTGGTTYALSGTVYGRDGVTPVQGAQCSLSPKSFCTECGSFSATTDSAGKYTMTGISSGSYSLRVSKNSYVALNTSVDVSSDTSKNCSIISQSEWSQFAGGDHPYDPNTGYVVVEVLDSAKKALLSGVDVDHYPADFSDLGHMSGSSVDWSLDKTTENGRALFYKVVPGSQYTVYAQKAGYVFDGQTSSKGSKSVSYTPTAGEVTEVTMTGKAQTGAYPSAIQRVYDLRPLKGLGYTPGPSDYKGDGTGYFTDSDFWNNDCQDLWGTGTKSRDDIGTFAQAGVNFLHLYDWNQKGSGRIHTNFLKYCQDKGIYVMVPISNWYLDHRNDSGNDAWWPNFVAEAYPGGTRHPAVLMWDFGNEWDNYTDDSYRNGKAQAVVDVVKKIIAAEDAAGIPDSERIAIIAPVTTGTWYNNGTMGAGATNKMKELFESNGLSTVFQNRFIAAVQGFQDGSAFSKWIGTDFPAAMKAINGGKVIPFMLTEMGWQINGTPDDAAEQAQAAKYEEQLKAVMPFAHGNDDLGPFMGTCVHQAVNAHWKSGTEATFGCNKIDVAGGINPSNGKFPVDSWKQKPNYAKMKQYYH
ncbi:MAG: carboxypeptidase regulatory-like domain-containing protein [Candidatus Eremiobacteraeota bacterium]|nr:carboxypeptidase regulatory-like domain-containing protein [Candidatus Eremiobacteraeota bacterium]